MLIGNAHLIYPSTLDLDHGGCDNGVTHEYAIGLSRMAAAQDRYVRWSCANGDPRDIRWFFRGDDITAAVEARIRREEAGEAAAQLHQLTQPYEVLGARVAIRPVRADRRPTGQVVLSIDGVDRIYEPGEIRARNGLDSDVVAAYDTMRALAARVVELAWAAAGAF